LHHGIHSSGSEVSMVRVVGAAPSKEIREEFKAYDLVTFEMTSDGFIARPLPQLSGRRARSAAP
jgi:hypothetical protein